MIMGVGADLVPVGRMERLLARRQESSLARLFTPAERERCERAARPAESYAARFAAKEAFFKALGTGWGRGGDWNQVEVINLASGAPVIRLSGRAGLLAREKGVTHSHLSLTHTRESAAAFVVLEQE